MARRRPGATRGEYVLVKPDGGQLGRIAEVIDEGRLKPAVAMTLPLREAARAHELSQQGHTRGKIVVQVV